MRQGDFQIVLINYSIYSAVDRWKSTSNSLLGSLPREHRTLQQGEGVARKPAMQQWQSMCTRLPACESMGIAQLNTMVAASSDEASSYQIAARLVREQCGDTSVRQRAIEWRHGTRIASRTREAAEVPTDQQTPNVARRMKICNVWWCDSLALGEGQSSS